jgi:Na+:H+ antiporter, NhaA family
MAVSLRPGPPLRIVTPRMTPAVRRFIANEAGSAAVLLAATVIALVWANSLWGHTYEDFWQAPFTIEVGTSGLHLDLRHFVNDAGMAVFFLVLGLEIAREMTAGELRDHGLLTVPAFGALGGMLVPIAIFLAINPSGPASHGWGVVMSSDTAFVLGVLALFGPRCPDQLRLFLLALAVVDDIGAISVMAVFYSEHVQVMPLILAAVLAAGFPLLSWLGVWRLTPYVLLTVALWSATYASGVHPTLAGVVAGLLIPAQDPEGRRARDLIPFGRAVVESPSPQRVRLANAAAAATVSANERLQSWLHPYSAYFVIPAFGLANAGVGLGWTQLRDASTSSVAIGVAVALLVGNAVGITVFSAIALRTGLGSLPGRVRYSHLIGGATLAGIGFTIALFITDLAFGDQPVIAAECKIGILAGSLVSAVVGAWVLRIMGERTSLCSPASDTAPVDLPPLPWRAPGDFGAPPA